VRSILDGPGSRFIPIHRPECVGCYKPLLPRALTETVRRSGTAKLLSRLAGAVARAVGGARPGQDRARPRPRVCPGWDAAADVAVLRAQPGVFGLVASDPTVSRLIARLATDADAALATLAGARAAAGSSMGLGRGTGAGRAAGSRSGTRPCLPRTRRNKTRRGSGWRTFGCHPLLGIVNHGTGGRGGRWPSCCARATPDRTPPPTTLPRTTRHSGRSRSGCAPPRAG